MSNPVPFPSFDALLELLEEPVSVQADVNWLLQEFVPAQVRAGDVEVGGSPSQRALHIRVPPRFSGGAREHVLNEHADAANVRCFMTSATDGAWPTLQIIQKSPEQRTES